MATLIEAVNAYRPRVVQKETIGMELLAERLARGSLFSESIARMVLTDLQAELRNGLRQGNPVRLPGIGRFAMHLRLDGQMRPSMSVDRSLRIALRDLDAFRGDIQGRENIGLSSREIVARWNEEHPDDPVELPPGFDLAA
jgi:nucleoid DNA-binding protein